jgi:hypothetical protein
MAKLVLTNAKLILNGSDVSSYVRQIAINYSAAEVESTAMGNAGQARLPGLFDWSMDVTFANDFAVGNLDSILFPLVGAAAPFAVEARAVNSARSTSNPAYVGNGNIFDYKPLGQKVGALAEGVVKIAGADGAQLTRLTA